MNVAVNGSKRRVAFALLSVVWMLKFILGLAAALGQHTPRYPSAVRGFPVRYTGEFVFYVVIPAVFWLLNLFMLVLSKKLPKWISIVVAILQLFLLLILLLLGTGGV